MLTVAYRGNFQPGVPNPWSTETHVAAALESLGHTVVRLQENSVTWAECVLAADRSDLFLWQRTWDIRPEDGHRALAAISGAGVPSVSFHLDLYIGLEREAQIAQADPFWRTSLVVTADGGHDDEFAAYGVNHRWLPPAVHEPHCRVGRRDRKRWPHDVIFVGSHPYPHPEWQAQRTGLIEALQARYGDRFKVWPHRERDGRAKPIRGRELSNLYASAKVVVGDSCLPNGQRRFWSDRIPETLGRSALLLHPEVGGMADWYEDGRDLLTYPVGDYDEVCRLVDRALADPEGSAVIAKQGQVTILGRDTYVHRMAEVIRFVEEMHGGEVPVRKLKPQPITVRHRVARVPATFELAEGTTDAMAVREVWENDDYLLRPEDVRGRVVVDVGANVGAFSVLAARMGAKRVHAYEPHPANAATLRANIESNRATVVTVHELAVAEDDAAWGIAGVGGGVHGDSVNADHVVQAVAIRGVIDETGDEVGLLKIDVEGAEYGIFAGELDWLDAVARIRGEFHGPGMPHLVHLDADGRHLVRWGAMFAGLAARGRLEIIGRPMVGGLFRWQRY